MIRATALLVPQTTKPESSSRGSNQAIILELGPSEWDMAIDDEQHEKKCAECQSPIHIGRDVIRVQEGVLGTRGFVDLNHELLFCNENCVRDYYADSEVVEMMRRIP